MWLGLEGTWEGDRDEGVLVTREQASSEGGGWVAGAAGAGVWLCPVGPRAGLACSAGSRLPSHRAFWLRERAAWEPGDLWREKKRGTHGGSDSRRPVRPSPWRLFHEGLRFFSVAIS